MHRLDVPRCFTTLAFTLVACSGPLHAAGPAMSDEDGTYYSGKGEPIYDIAPDGRVDWYTFNGFRRYHGECHMCHGANGEGGTFAPSLLGPLKTMDYETFRDIIVHGIRNVGPAQQRVMQAMGENRNVMCYLPDIYVYLKARADGALGRFRPDNHQLKPDAATRHEAACLDHR